MNIETKIWKMIDGEITELKHNNTIFTIKESTIIKIEPKTELKANTTYMVPTAILPPKKTYKHGIKKSYLEKWINDGHFTVFTLEMFLKAYPLQKKNRRLDSIISRLIADKKILQLGKNKFKVNI